MKSRRHNTHPVKQNRRLPPPPASPPVTTAMPEPEQDQPNRPPWVPLPTAVGGRTQEAAGSDPSSSSVPSIKSPQVHRLSLSPRSPRSPRSNAGLSDLDYEADDVFSNPDTAETAATSPDRVTSPTNDDADTRGRAMASMPDHPFFAPRQQQQGQPADDDKDQQQSLHHQPSRDSQSTAYQRSYQGASETGPTTTTTHVSPLRTAASATASRSHSTHRGSQTVQQFRYEDLPLPSANDLPTDPEEASNISSLFPHPLAPTSEPTSHASPAGSAIRLALASSPIFASEAPVTSRSASAAGSPLSEKPGFQWNPPWPRSASTSRPIGGRPDSPERQRTLTQPMGSQQKPGGSSEQELAGPSRHRATSSGPTTSPDNQLGLGFASPSRADLFGSTSNNAESPASIFERNIEHRDARHVLSKAEAVDVAIPAVLDDAVEALTEGGEQGLEIVSPLSTTSSVPLALSAGALSVHCSSNSGFSSGPLTSSSPPRSSAGLVMPGDAPPPGSIAAQIAERLAPSRGLDDSSSVLPGGEPRMRHRSNVSSDVSSLAGSTQQRSPISPASVQQVLDSSVSPIVARASSPPLPRTAREKSPASDGLVGEATGGAQVASGGASGPATRPASQQLNPNLVGTSFPSLPLPNPFRSETPAGLQQQHHRRTPSTISNLAEPSGLLTMSLDGAIIPSSESAIAGMSLDSMADVLAEEEVLDDRASSQGDLSPILPRKTAAPATTAAAPSASPWSLAAFGRRDTAQTITPETMEMLADEDHMPGGFPGEALMESSSTTSGPPSQDVGSSPATRRVSFFSYADIINETPAEVVDFEQSVQKVAAEEDAAAAIAAIDQLALTGSTSSTATTGLVSGLGSVGGGGASTSKAMRGSAAASLTNSQTTSPRLTHG